MLRAESFVAPPDLFACNAERDDFDSTEWRLTALGLWIFWPRTIIVADVVWLGHENRKWWADLAIVLSEVEAKISGNGSGDLSLLVLATLVDARDGEARAKRG